MNQFQISSNDETFDSLVAAYSEKHRHYHNCSHIDAVLTHLDKVQDLTKAPHEIELALWFHDAVYEPFSSDNERTSAEWAIDFLTTNYRPEDERLRIYNLIMATLHIDREGTSDEQLMVDIDLTILGANEKIYGEFERNIRKEYKLVPYFLYRKKRKEILLRFLKRDRIFNNNYFHDRIDKLARINLETAINSL